MIVSKKIIALKERLADVELRLAVARHRPNPYTVVIETLESESAALRQQLLDARRAHPSLALQGGAR